MLFGADAVTRMFTTVKSTLERGIIKKDGLDKEKKETLMETNPLLLREERTTASDEDTVECSDSGDDDDAIPVFSVSSDICGVFAVSILLLLIFIKIVVIGASIVMKVAGK